MMSNNVSPAAAIRAVPARSFVRVESIPGTSTTIRKALSRAAKDGVVVRVAPGVYYKGVPTKYGMTRPADGEALKVMLGERGVGPAGYSAARAWGVTTQIPAVTELATLGARKKLKNVKLITRSNLGRADLNEMEIALLELLRDPATLVESGWDSLIERVKKAADDGRIRPRALRAALPGESSPAVRDNFAKLGPDLSTGT
ncbi:MAG: hypothetical protein Q7T17_17070 [Microbacterium sp.]|uniref:hypothetical protein n=1 Tax=Microbacterium sp. TaxID=51671 RepID=UPI0027278E54|nr:hypothetical protein [Microbacterium sp.]MDO8384673.1 hypothetical protein [Microbacterium sp.]